MCALGLRLALGRCRASNSIRFSVQMNHKISHLKGLQRTVPDKLVALASSIKTSTLDLQERQRSEFLLTVLYLDYEDLYCYCNWVCFHSDDRLFSYRILDGCELRLVTNSQMRLAYARAMRAIGLRLALGRCRASNSIHPCKLTGDCFVYVYTGLTLLWWHGGWCLV
jgi:hypothetical protein